MRKPDLDISEVKKLVELVETYNLEELSIEGAGISITVKGRGAGGTTQVVVPSGGVPAPEPVADYEEAAEEAPEELEGDIVDIVAPLVGVFYRSPSPDADPFIEVGSIIEVGSEVGLIEAMKVFSPIPSEVAGEVVDLPAQNGKLVRQGDVLVRVRVSGEQVQL